MMQACLKRNHGRQSTRKIVKMTAKTLDDDEKAVYDIIKTAYYAMTKRIELDKKAAAPRPRPTVDDSSSAASSSSSSSSSSTSAAEADVVIKPVPEFDWSVPNDNHINNMVCDNAIESLQLTLIIINIQFVLHYCSP
jgi:hypothetical protein